MTLQYKQIEMTARLEVKHNIIIIYKKKKKQ